MSCNANVDIFREVPVAVHVSSAGVANLGDGELQPDAYALPQPREVGSIPHCQPGTFQSFKLLHYSLIFYFHLRIIVKFALSVCWVSV